MNHDEQQGFAEMRQWRRQLADLGNVKAPSSVIPMVLSHVGLADVYFRLESPIGRVLVAFSDHGVSAVMLADNPTGFEEAFRARFGRTARRIEQPPRELATMIEAQWSGRRPNRLRFDLRGCSEFERAVLAKALEIPRGEVRPYAWIAAEIGRPRAGRAVGTALGRNPIPLLIPCHRVVRSDGRTGDYVFGPEAKCALLQTEGIQPAQLEPLARTRVRYVGSDTTHIFCYPTCQHARHISPQHRVAFRSGAEALAAGYRPCKVCRPAGTAG